MIGAGVAWGDDGVPVGAGAAAGASLVEAAGFALFARIFASSARFEARLAVAFALPFRAPPRLSFASSAAAVERAAKN